MFIQQMTLDAMWDDFQANRGGAPYRSELLVRTTEELAESIEELYRGVTLENSAGSELEERSEEIEKASSRITELVNYGTEAPQINVAELPDEGLDVRLQRLVNLSRRLIPNLLFLVGSEAVNLNLLNQIRDDLAITGALTRALPGSAF